MSDYMYEFNKEVFERELAKAGTGETALLAALGFDARNTADIDRAQQALAEGKMSSAEMGILACALALFHGCNVPEIVDFDVCSTLKCLDDENRRVVYRALLNAYPCPHYVER